MFYNRVFSRCFRAHDKVLNDQLAFGKYNNRTLKYSSNIKHYYIANFYFSSNQGSCASQVKKCHDVGDIKMSTTILRCSSHLFDISAEELCLKVYRVYGHHIMVSPKFQSCNENILSPTSMSPFLIFRK